jgi:hypothetical protein
LDALIPMSTARSDLKTENDEFLDTLPLSEECLHRTEIAALKLQCEKEKDALKSASASTLSKLAEKLQAKETALQRRGEEIASLRVELSRAERGGESLVRSELSDVLTGALEAKERKLKALEQELEHQQGVVEGYIEREQEYVAEITRLEACSAQQCEPNQGASPRGLASARKADRAPIMTISALSTPASFAAFPSASMNDALQLALEGEREALRREAAMKAQLASWEEAQRARHAEHLVSLSLLEQTLEADRTKQGSSPGVVTEKAGASPEACASITMSVGEHRALREENEAQRKELVHIYEWMMERRLPARPREAVGT